MRFFQSVPYSEIRFLTLSSCTGYHVQGPNFKGFNFSKTKPFHEFVQLLLERKGISSKIGLFGTPYSQKIVSHVWSGRKTFFELLFKNTLIAFGRSKNWSILGCSESWLTFFAIIITPPPTYLLLTLFLKIIERKAVRFLK